VPLGEVLQDSWTIVADRRQLNSLRLESLLCALQLHELRFAKGSPISGAEEKEDRALGPLESLVGVLLAELINHSKCRGLLADLQTDGGKNHLIAGPGDLAIRKGTQSHQENDINYSSHLDPDSTYDAFLKPLPSSRT